MILRYNTFNRINCMDIKGMDESGRVQTMNERLIDINDLSKVLKINPKTIRNKLSNGSWPIEPMRVGKMLRWRVSDVEAFLSQDIER